DISAPSSATESAARALTAAPGRVPAEWTSTRSPACSRISAAAIWDLPPFLTQTKRTLGVLGLLVMIGLQWRNGWAGSDRRGRVGGPARVRRRPGRPARGPR